MGEAKRRKDAGEVRPDLAAQIALAGEAKHYCFILDRSDAGRRALAQMKHGPEEVQARVTGSAFKTWEALPHFGFVIVWGTWGLGGGLTMPAMDLTAVLTVGLPKAIERTLEKGGLCTVLPFVDPAHVEAIVARVGELQPTMGSAS